MKKNRKKYSEKWFEKYRLSMNRKYLTILLLFAVILTALMETYRQREHNNYQRLLKD